MSGYHYLNLICAKSKVVPNYQTQVSTNTTQVTI